MAKTVTKEGNLTDTNIASLANWFKITFAGRKIFFGVEDVSIFQAPISRNVGGYFQKNKGALVALSHVYAKKIFMVAPKTWQAEFGISKADKDKSVKIACELFPELAAIIDAAPGAYKHGLAEASLGAEYIRRKYVVVLSLNQVKHSEVTFCFCDPGPGSGAIVEISLDGELLNWTLMPKLQLKVMKTRKVKEKNDVSTTEQSNGSTSSEKRSSNRVSKPDAETRLPVRKKTANG